MMKLFIYSCLLFFKFKSTRGADTISPSETLRDANETLISADETYELGFFSPSNSSNRYIGIWFKNIPQQVVVWVANKNNPLTDSSGALTITTTGSIIIFNNQSATTMWSSNSSASNPVMQLLSTGNLVVKDGISGNYIWESFDYPCNTLLPGMKLGLNLRTGQDWYLTSWRSQQDPSDGEYTYKFDATGLPQLALRKGSHVEYRSGPWDGARFGGGPKLGENSVFNPILISNETFVYYSFESSDNSTISRFVLHESSLVQHLAWNQRTNVWDEIIRLQADRCDTYQLCGPNGICNLNESPICECPTGFEPRLPQDWQMSNWSGGCLERRPVSCGDNIGFRVFSRLKLPESSYLFPNMTNLADCEAACSRNCLCKAYTRTDVTGCVVWYGDLLDIRGYDEGGQNLYIRLLASELDSGDSGKTTVVIVSVLVVSVVVLVGLVGWYVIWKRKENGRRKEAQNYSNNDIGQEDLESPLFDLVTIATATNDFSFRNKLGEGGFGPVYKGTLSSGQEIAVKRLSKESGQGLKELMNEIILISKLQHRNLVKLLGCCIHGEERMLIYEYMPNKSLDLFIFNQTRDTSLDWQKLFDIIVGIARGVLYLHRDSRLRIIHRDLKASNILLDHDMNPKISDFGLARMFRADQTEAETNRVIGTYGYMSPEYAIDGVFSVKSDVFSFGVLVLEIVSGRRNRGFYHADHDFNLLGHAWTLWNERRPLELMNASIENSVSKAGVLRCIQVGLLCVQQRPEDRPSSSLVLLMLDSGENLVLPEPKQPGFYTHRFSADADSSSTGKKPMASNEITISMLRGR